MRCGYRLDAGTSGGWRRRTRRITGSAACTTILGYDALTSTHHSGAASK